MSYYLKMYFIERVEPELAFILISKFKEYYNDYAEKFVVRHFEERPSIYGEWDYKHFEEYVKDEKLKLLNETWLRQLFTVNFVYYPKLKLLAFRTDADDSFDTIFHYIEFQNSCDQDYPLEYYSGISFAEKMYKEMFRSKNKRSKEWRDYISDKSFNNDEQFNYIKRTFVYEKIEKTLDIKKLMHPIEFFDDENHYSLNINMISEIKANELSKTLNDLIKNEYKKINNS